MKRSWARAIITGCGWAYCSVILVILFIPAIIVLPSSLSNSDILDFPPDGFTLRWYSMVFHSADWLQSARVSLSLSLAVACLTCLIAFFVGLAQYRKGSLSALDKTVLTLPAVVPQIVIATGAFGILVTIRGALGSLWSLVLIDTALALPVVLAILLPTFQTIDPLLWTAAGTLGAKPYQIACKIIVPNVAIALVTSAILAFHTAWEETTIAVFIGPTVSPPIPSRLYSYLQQNVTPEVAALASLLVLSTLLGAGMILLLSIVSKRYRFQNAANELIRK